MKGNGDEMNIKLLEEIIEKLDNLERKMDAVVNDVAEIKEKVNDDTPQYSQWYNGGAR
jgi:tetrahydromethanopterin S-methyltransferase subunit G